MAFSLLSWTLFLSTLRRSRFGRPFFWLALKLLVLKSSVLAQTGLMLMPFFVGALMLLVLILFVVFFCLHFCFIFYFVLLLTLLLRQNNNNKNSSTLFELFTRQKRELMVTICGRLLCVFCIAYFYGLACR